MSVDAADERTLQALLHKYEELLRLRRDREEGKPLPEPQAFRALASTFPGALAELDTLPMDALARRAEDVRRALEGASPEPWIAMMLGYHALMRAALYIRMRASKQRDVSDARASDLALDASAHAGMSVDAAFVRAVLAPPEGRIVGVVLSRLSSELSLPMSALRAVLSSRARRRAARQA